MFKVVILNSCQTGELLYNDSVPSGTNKFLVERLLSPWNTELFMLNGSGHETLIEFKSLQKAKAPLLIVDTVWGMFIVAKLKQFEKAFSPILLRVFGNETVCKLIQPEKVEEEMLSTDDGIFTDVRPVQPEKAEAPINETLLGILTPIKLLDWENASSPMPLTLKDIPALITVSGMLATPEKSEFPLTLAVKGFKEFTW